MEALLQDWYAAWPLWGLFAAIVVLLLVLGKGADLLVDHAVILARRWGMSAAIIGATIVSLGTTTPEAAVSVAAAVGGNPDLALGNAVGSIICDTGLILGLAVLIGKVPIDRRLSARQGRLQIGAGILLVLACLPWSHLGGVFTTGGGLPQWVGWVFLGLLVVYLYLSYRWGKALSETTLDQPEASHQPPEGAAMAQWRIWMGLLLGLVLVLIASKLIIPAVEVAAVRLSIPPAIIAATLVAFGTSLPELVTAVTSVRKGHGELALGNVIGADILNVLFVSGAAAAVTSGGLVAGPSFFTHLFPGMLALLILLRLGIRFSGDHLGKTWGVLLLVGYVLVTVLSYTI